MAVTPIPPAAHTEISPRFALASPARILASVPRIRVAGGGERVPDRGTLPPFTLSLPKVDVAERRGQIQHIAAVLR